MDNSEVFTLAYRTVASNRLRTGITVAIIAFGIMALIGIITAIEAMKQSLKENFSAMGANSFTVRFKESRAHIGHKDHDDLELSKRGQKQKKSNLGKPIRKEEAVLFRDSFGFPAKSTAYFRMGNSVECRYASKKTNPQCTVWGVDENYLEVIGYSLKAGRNLTPDDIRSGRPVCLLGSNVAAKLFGEAFQNAIGREISVGGAGCKVVGVLASKGSSSFLRQDEVVVISYNSTLRFNNPAQSFTLAVAVKQVSHLPVAIGEATSRFRSIRKLVPLEEDNFVIEKSDKIAQMFISFFASITGTAGAIGFITVLGAAIGLMNIMLVAVAERTKEVGLVKAIGGRRADIARQFLFESIIISLMGALAGIFLGVLVGNLIGLVLHTGFVVPWAWVAAGIAICTLVGILAGILPARKAAKLDPIKALRYE